ncbi:hypothetical protein GCM10022287_19740 [Gryllotalpicola koreensis]|uniref:Uncharacterized protein n=1 Tax=Gryllotalpicola koreensis TaxID=993086 RepID=A0ABP8A0N1_9MICO
MQEPAQAVALGCAVRDDDIGDLRRPARGDEQPGERLIALRLGRGGRRLRGRAGRGCGIRHLTVAIHASTYVTESKRGGLLEPEFRTQAARGQPD